MGFKIRVNLSNMVGVGVATAVSSAVIFFIVVLNLTTTVSAQLDLPSMPGPPYPDPRGNNRWGVKFDPRKHGPPFDKRGSAQRNVWHRGPPGRFSKGRDRDRDRDRSRPSRERDSYWSPGKMRRHSRQPLPRSRRQNRFYGNDITRRRPRSHMAAYKSKEKGWRWPEEDEGEDFDRDTQNVPTSSRRPSKAEQQKFWKSWNAWYKKQADVKEQLRKDRANKHAFPYDQEEEHVRGRRPMYVVDAEEFKKVRIQDEDDENNYGYYQNHRPNSILGQASYKIRDFYRTGLRDVVRRAKSLTSSFVEGGGDDEGEVTKNEETGEKPEGWSIFTTIGKGLDAANDAMGTVRKTVGGTVLGTGIKYGGKMAMNAVMNVGTSALTSAIQSATLG